MGKDRSFTITNGKVVTFIDNPPKGYGLIYDATTRIGNSGGPVFDTEGKVIGIHGLADTDSLESDNTNQSETRNNLNEPICFNGSNIDFTDTLEVHNSITNLLTWIDPEIIKLIADIELS